MSMSPSPAEWNLLSVVAGWRLDEARLGGYTTGREELTDAGGEDADAKHDTDEESGDPHNGEYALGGEGLAGAIVAVVDEGRVGGDALNVSELGVLHGGH